VAGLVQIGKKNRYPFRILPQVLEVNALQRRQFLKKVSKAVGPLKGKTLAVWGLAFKPNTDDLREAPSLTVVPALAAKGAKLRLYDPAAMPAAKNILKKAVYCKDPYEAARGADAVLVLTEWNEFIQVDFQKLRKAVKRPVIVDGRNIYDPLELADKGFTYYGMGRAASFAF
jgi:UDPglucose 6-dehydrogenase